MNNYTVAMSDAVIRARIDVQLKADAPGVLGACDLELSDGIRLYLQQGGEGGHLLQTPKC